MSPVEARGCIVVVLCALCILPGYEATPEETKEGAGLFGPSAERHDTPARHPAHNIEAIADATEAHAVSRAVKAEQLMSQFGKVTKDSFRAEQCSTSLVKAAQST